MRLPILSLPKGAVAGKRGGFPLSRGKACALAFVPHPVFLSDSQEPYNNCVNKTG